uniref:Uncharacterized protein n=1 Tax=Vitis vinifera TaxID=29760 RepID=F6I4C6_VITVI
MAILSRAHKTLLKTLNHHNNPFKASISTFTFLSLEAQLAEPSLPPPSPTPLPPNPASGSPLYKWIARGENARGHVLLSVDEGLVVSTLGTAGRTYSSTLVDASWAILRDHCVKRRHLN